jgi:sporulation protein YlmC with PRC-barrel domain
MGPCPLAKQSRENFTWARRIQIEAPPFIPMLSHTIKSNQEFPKMADIETDETEALIASNKVEGTAVYNPDGDKLGSIYNFMVDKESGQVEYAVLQFGGFLGLGSDHYPVPWAALEYDEEEGGYVLDVDKEFLESAPRFSANEASRFTPFYGREVDTAYGVEYEDA